jgi:hypothetical protein
MSIDRVVSWLRPVRPCSRPLDPISSDNVCTCIESHAAVRGYKRPAGHPQLRAAAAEGAHSRRCRVSDVTRPISHGWTDHAKRAAHIRPPLVYSNFALPANIYAVLGECWIVTNKDRVLSISLRYQHAIEWVSMVRRKAAER